MKNNLVRIVDLDGTVSDDSWRLWMIDWKEPDSVAKYHAYHIHCDRDHVINRSVVDDSPVPVVFLTSRPEYLRRKTAQWLFENNLSHIALLMRGNEDHTPSPQLKKSALVQIRAFFEIERAYDDREDVVQMFLANSVEAILV